MKRILFAIPLPYGPDWGFWTRDSGVVVLVLREMGYDAWLVALGDSSTVTTGRPILPISLDTMQDPEWWRSQKPDGVILNTWSAPRYGAIRRAAAAATSCIVERLDTDGVRSARLFPGPFVVRSWAAYSDMLPGYARWLAAPAAVLRTGLLYLMPGLLDARIAAAMQNLPAVVAESPGAAARIQRMFETFSKTPHRIDVIPHPVNEDVINYRAAPKENQIITVGRWATAQKDFPMLLRVLKGFLISHPDWRAIVVGSGVPAREHAIDPSEEWRSRIIFHEKLTHEQLVVEYNRSKIYLMVSRFESFCIAAAEALCCGCSVVGSCTVVTSSYFAELDSGTVAAPRTTKGFLQALDRELACWSQGERNPAAIASVWRARLGSHAVARAVLALLGDIRRGETSPV
jgi:glycosyltransferase involved in cell wall biosynthesis